MDRLHLNEIQDAELGTKGRELPDGLHVGAASIGMRMCELKESRIRVRVSGRAVKIAGREVDDETS